MVEWWEENGPPVYVAVAGYLGLIKKRSSKSSNKKESGGFAELAKLFGPTGMLNG